MRTEIAGIDWDEGNLAKCQKHGLSIEEIEGLFGSDTLTVFPDPFPDEQRLRAIGRAPSGRHVFVVYTIRDIGGALHIRPISARYMHEKEIQHYERQQAATSRLPK
ncbi:BrnT family toxin [Devosia sp. D6-9]|nr:BrnT family toxin [Devosia sp. D6-9]